MKLFKRVLLFSITFCVLGFIPKENGFEGKLNYVIKREMPNKENNYVLDFYIKGKKALIEVNKKSRSLSVNMLIDKAQSDFYVLMDQNGRKMAMKQKLKTLQEEQKNNEQNIRKTDQTKTIKGYKCRLYKIDQKNYKGNAWVTREIDINMGAMFNVINKNPARKGKGGSMMASDYPEKGVVMQSDLEHKKKDGNIKMTLKSVDKKSISKKRFDISDYQVMDVSDGGMPSSR